MGMGMPLEGEYTILVHCQPKCPGSLGWTRSILWPACTPWNYTFICIHWHKNGFNLTGWSGGWFWIMELATLTWRKEWKMLLFLPATCLWSMKKREYTANPRVLRTFIWVVLKYQPKGLWRWKVMLLLQPSWERWWVKKCLWEAELHSGFHFVVWSQKGWKSLFSWA